MIPGNSNINSLLRQLRAGSFLPDFIKAAGGEPIAGSLEELAALVGATPVDENTLEPLKDIKSSNG